MTEQQGTQDILSRLLEDPEIQAAGQQDDQGSNMPDTSEAMQGLPFALPPDLLGKLPALFSALGPMMGGKDAGGARDQKTALLLALKPYMSPQRCDAIDKLIMFGKLSQIMQQLK